MRKKSVGKTAFFEMVFSVLPGSLDIQRGFSIEGPKCFVGDYNR